SRCRQWGSAAPADRPHVRSAILNPVPRPALWTSDDRDSWTPRVDCTRPNDLFKWSPGGGTREWRGDIGNRGGALRDQVIDRVYNGPGERPVRDRTGDQA